jgi:transposase
LKGYITNTTLTGKEVIENYNNLWLIEKAFRISKTDLKIRPTYHRLRERIEAHICISFVSYLLFKEFERVLAQGKVKVSVNQAIKQINKLHEIVYQYPNGNNQWILLKNNPIQEQIMEVIKAEF